MPALRFFVSGLTILLATIAPCPLSADAGFDDALRWRNVGPFRGGRTRAIAGVPSQPNVFYMAQVNGGVFKTTDYGRTWQPIFDDQPTGSVGAIAVSISNPEIVYVGRAKVYIGRTYRSVMAFTNRLTREKPGRIWDCAMDNRWRSSRSIREIPIDSLLR